MINLISKSNASFKTVTVVASVKATNQNTVIKFCAKKDKLDESKNFIEVSIENENVLKSKTRYFVSSADFDKAINDSFAVIQKFVDCKTKEDLMEI